MINNENLKYILHELKINQYRIKEDIKNYYNEEEDNENIKRYYQSIDFEDTNNLLEDIRALVINTHHTEISYKEAKEHLYKLVDLQPDGNLKSIYCGATKEPSQAIEHDYITMINISRCLEDLRRSESIENLEQEIRNVYKNNKFNCEHVVCLSWFNKKVPMKGDLHHLFACEPDCNNFRTNYGYHDFIDSTPDAKNECGKRCTINCLFEPEYGKGEVARATLYFLLRYHSELLDEYKERIDIELMIKWHKEYEVSLYEKHRNNEIYNIQGNRNPFIDFPDVDFGISL